MDLLEHHQASFKEARARLTVALSNPFPEGGEQILQWISDKDLDPAQIFVDSEHVSLMQSAQGAVRLLALLNAAFKADRIWYPVLEKAGPRIAFISPKASNTKDILYQKSGPGAPDRVIGTCKDLDAFIAAIEARRRR